MFRWLFGRRSIGGIVASITKMRRKLHEAMESASEEIEKREIKIIAAEVKSEKAIQKAKDKLVKTETKERKEIDLSIDEIGDAQAWLDALPTIGTKSEPNIETPEVEDPAKSDGDDAEEHS